ncbi:glycosyltransferase family 4 protein [Frigoribacterium sp. ACAM 257]|uniref:glycosyltransferase family 4 protein n=1 Tax=Frigoribacterium sp. ACAM 257 TaxID=2508998 RepID=UPI0011BA0E3F|nr:glycosyltransferase family 4 protein [Frigoribacterium sp. ACAM 257]TWX40659.1 glycosyltransferase family 4 protein [Frigoribacterium sp. ACAM 257]
MIDTPPPARDALRVASVPAGHPYVRHLQPVDDSAVSRAVIRLADPLPDPAEPARWWPPVVLDAGWIAEHAAEVDVLHVHFGTESYDLGHLRRVVDAARAARIPLVHTVHDLVNPQLVDQAPHLAHLGLLVAESDELLTLTEGAAAEIERTFGRRPVVVPHPHLLPLDAVAPTGTAHVEVVVGVSLRDLRPNVDGPGSVSTLIAAAGLLAAAGRPVTVRVDVNERVRDAVALAEVRALVAGAPGHLDVSLVVHPRLDDDELAEALADLDVVVLPYSHGTHSGWVELSWDLGVPVAAPRVGHVDDQHPAAGDTASFDAGDADQLAAAVDSLVRARADVSARPGSASRRALVAGRREQRRAQRDEIAQAHLAAYERAVASATARPAPSTAASSSAARPAELVS